jgi:ribosomal-protein-alanine N-acetyltransferase
LTRQQNIFVGRRRPFSGAGRPPKAIIAHRNMEAELLSLQTERLLLQILNPEVYRHVFSSFSDEGIKEFFGFDSDDALHNERQKYEAGLTSYNRSFLSFQLIDKESGKIIGACGFHTWNVQHARAEIGYAITNESYKRKGLMKEAMKAIIDYGFRKMHLNRIEALIGPDNVASLRLARAFGFTEEGRLRQHYFKGGSIEDSILFSLLREEYFGGNGE